MKILVHLTTKILNGEKPGVNPKNYPWRIQLLTALKDAGHTVVEIDKPIPLGESRKLIADADIVVCIDSYLQHLCWYMDKVAIVIFGQSDPLIFGHSSNINILKDRKYLREQQFWLWEQTTANDEAFVEPEVILKEIEKVAASTL